MATITATISNKTVTVASSGSYASPLTISTSGYIDNTSGGSGMYGPSAGANYFVYNQGRITATGAVAHGILFEDGGTIINSGTIRAAYGIVIFNGVSTVINTGTIVAPTVGEYSYGVRLHSGYVSNSSVGYIHGDNRGVSGDSIAAVTLVNAGRITGGSYVNGSGVQLDGGGVLTNSGTITDAGAYGVILNAATTVTNSGTISGGGGKGAIEFLAAGGGNVLALENGYSLVGGLFLASSANTLELLGATGAVTVAFDKVGAGFTSFGTVAFGAAGGNNETLTITNTTGTPGATITGFGTVNDIIDLTAIGTDGTITQNDTVNHRVTITGSAGTVTLQLDASEGTNLSTVSDGTTGTDLTPCFLRGTLIRTEQGEAAVEDLAIGDKVMTLSGMARPVKWIGHRAYDPRFVAGNRTVLPIRVEAGALGDGVPARDLFLSPEHALSIGGLLVPARLLVNGIAIRQVEIVERLEYFHIELDSHDVIFAGGAPAESFADSDNRGMFHNAGEFAALYPAELSESREFCAPRVAEDSAELTAIRRALLERAEALSRATRDPDLHLVADGTIVHAASGRDGVYRFAVAAGTRRVTLVSRSAVPAEVYPSSLDGRALGIPVERIVLSDAGLRVEIGHNCPALGEGFHDDEAAQRWSDGRGCLPEGILACFAGDIAITVHLAPSALIYPPDSPTGVADPDATGALPAAEPTGPGGLRGYVDVIRPDRICGWAMIAGDPETPVALDIYVGGTLRGRTVANRYRADLQSLGSGRHAFEFHPPMGLHFAPGSIEVRHSWDGAALPRSTDLTQRLNYQPQGVAAAHQRVSSTTSGR